MKRFLTFVAIAFLGMSMVSAKELNPVQVKFRDAMLVSIAAEGYNPKLDDDGDIIFKAEGLTCLLVISEKEENPFYVSINAVYGLDSSEEVLQVAYLSNKIADLKTAKLQIYNQKVVLSTEFFVADQTHFEKVFPRYIEVLTSASSKLKSWLHSMNNL